MSTRVASALGAVEAYGAAWNAHDAGACGALFTDDGVREWMVKPVSPNVPSRYEGRAAVVEGIQGFMTALPDLRVEMGNTWEIPGGAILEWRVEGTHQADWDMWNAQGEAVSFPGVSIYRVQDGRFGEERMYWDTALMVANWRPPVA